MAVLTTRGRKRIDKSRFGIPEKAPGSGSYPMPDLAHARNALARVAQHGTEQEKARVRRKAYSLFPSLKPKAPNPSGPRMASKKETYVWPRTVGGRQGKV